MRNRIEISGPVAERVVVIEGVASKSGLAHHGMRVRLEQVARR
jgi:hypothetical protein